MYGAMYGASYVKIETKIKIYVSEYLKANGYSFYYLITLYFPVFSYFFVWLMSVRYGTPGIPKINFHFFTENGTGTVQYNLPIFLSVIDEYCRVDFL